MPKCARACRRVSAVCAFACARVAGLRRRRLQQRAVGQDVLALLARELEERALGVLVRLVHEQRRRLRETLRDDVGEVVDDVDGRLVAWRGQRLVFLEHKLLRRGALDPPPGRARGAAHGAARAAQDRAGRGAGEEQRAGDERRHADDERAGRAEELREAAAEQAADRAAVIRAEGDQQAGDREHEPGAERPHLDERAAKEHERADDRQRDRHGVRGAADDIPERRLDLLADDAALPAHQEQRGQEEPERGEPEADQLRMLVPADPPLALRALLDPRGGARAQRPLLSTRGHAASLLRAPVVSCGRDAPMLSGA